MHSRALVLLTALLLFTVSTVEAQQRQIHIPQLDGDWWQIAGNPDLGACSTPRQQPVDFGIWQAADSTWQLWSCIRHTACGKNTRLFYGWEGADLTAPGWKPMGIKMQADTTLGEQSGGLQAPYVMTIDQVYYLFYGDWTRICLAKSFDGKHFTRVLNGRGQPDLFTEHAFEPCGNNRARDPMVMRRGNTYYCYYTSHITTHGEDGGPSAALRSTCATGASRSWYRRQPPYMGNSPAVSRTSALSWCTGRKTACITISSPSSTAKTAGPPSMPHPIPCISASTTIPIKSVPCRWRPRNSFTTKASGYRVHHAGLRGYLYVQIEMGNSHEHLRGIRSESPG
jgi:hypothetical protein